MDVGFCAAAGLLICRVVIALLLRTSFVPDEYYQSTDPAYRLVFGGNGGESTWEWQFEHRIRSYVLILPYACFFWLLKVLSVTSPVVARLGCRVVQACVTAAGDTALFHFVRNVQPGAELHALFAHLFSWSILYCGCRTLANTTEMALVCVVLFLDSRKSTRAAVAPTMTLLVLARPTAVLFCAAYLLSDCSGDSLRRALSPSCLLFCSLVALVCVIIDSWCYGIWTLSFFNFARVNVFQGVAASFGSQPWHWNFSVGLPAALGLWTPCAVAVAAGWAAGIIVVNAKVKAKAKNKAQTGGKGKGKDEALSSRRLVERGAGASLAYAAGLQLLTSHQELRFLLPMLPGVHAMLGCVAARLSASKGRPWATRLTAAAVVAAAAVHTAAALYLMTRHQAGAEAALSFLAGRLCALPPSSSPLHIVVVAPCFSFPPLQQFLHLGAPGAPSVRVSKLSCSPFDDAAQRARQELLRVSPAKFLAAAGPADVVLTFDSYLPPAASLPLHPEDQDQVRTQQDLRVALERSGLDLAWRFQHADVRYDYDDPHINLAALVFFSRRVTETGGS